MIFHDSGLQLLTEDGIGFTQSEESYLEMSLRVGHRSTPSQKLLRCPEHHLVTFLLQKPQTETSIWQEVLQKVQLHAATVKLNKQTKKRVLFVFHFFHSTLIGLAVVSANGITHLLTYRKPHCSF